MTRDRNGWIHCRLGEVCHIAHGFAFSGSAMNVSDDSSLPVIVTIGNFRYEGGFRFEETPVKRLAGAIPNGSILKAGAVLLIMTCQTPDGAVLGIPARIPDDGQTYLHNQRMGLANILAPELLNADYLYHLCCSGSFRRHLFETAGGTKVLHTSPTKIEAFPCNLPPVTEQTHIAHILNEWDTCIETLEGDVSAKVDRKQGLMQQLLTARKRLKEFKGERWKMFKLGELFAERVEIGRGDLPLVSITGQNGVVPRDSLAKRDTSSEDKSKYLRIAPGDIGYNTMRMWQGVAGLSKLEGIVSPAYTICIPSKRIDGQFAAYLFKHTPVVHLFRRHSQGLVDDTLALKFPNFARIHVTIPDIPEQRRIAAVLSTSDREIELLQKQLEALKEQKRGLMQKLLTGEVRVKAEGRMKNEELKAKG